jgi:ferredoxin
LAESTISRDRAAKLRTLAALMNTRHKIAFPVNDAMLRCFDLVLTSEEIDFLLQMGTEPYSYETAATTSALSADEFKAFFEALIRKGFVWPSETGTEKEYILPGMMVGWFEVYLSDGAETPVKREFARRVDAMLKSYARLNMFPTRSLINHRFRKAVPFQSILAPGSAPPRGNGRTIPVGKTLDAEPAKVYPAKTVEALIEAQEDGDAIAVVHCFCRQYRKMIDRACRFNHPPQSCIAVGALGRYAVEHGVGRFISKSEAISLLHEMQAKGAVHQVFHKNEDFHNPELAICNCCWDCCGVFGSYNRGILPLNLHCYYEARLADLAACTGCGACADFCPVQAIRMVEDKCAIDRATCIGCGQCQIHCPAEAICLIENERRVFLPLKKKTEARIRE